MSAIKNYFKEQFKLRMFALDYSNPSSFYLSCWQSTRSTVPFLIVRVLLLALAVAITLHSFILYIKWGMVNYWFIYLTHWGLLSLVVTTSFGTAISVRCFIRGPLNAEFGLPWYVKTYWVLYNIAVPLAFVITIFYWSLLYEAGIEEEYDHWLDIAVHGLNSVTMMALLLTSSHPTRLLHIVHPMAFTLVFVFFSIIYYLAGGVNTKGERWIYPVLNWANPGTCMLVALVTGLLLLVTQLFTAGLVCLRDWLAKKYVNAPEEFYVEEGYPLRQPRVRPSS